MTARPSGIPSGNGHHTHSKSSRHNFFNRMFIIFSGMSPRDQISDSLVRSPSTVADRSAQVK